MPHASREAEQADPEHNTIRPTDEFWIVGPDGMVYGRTPDGKYQRQLSTALDDIALPTA